MKEDTLARVYAEALVELAESKDQLSTVSEELDLFRRLFAEDRNLRVFMESPSIGAADRIRVFETTFRGRISDTALNFLLLVVRRGRQFLFLGMIEEFQRMYAAKMGIVNASVSTVVELSEASRGALQSRLEKGLGKRVILENVLDDGILGGFVVRYDGMVADASLQRELDDMKESTRRVEFGSELIHED